jgi:DNA-binding HxlR family transcriptional regulator
VERDFQVLRELERWRFCLSRHLRFLGGFASQRTCDRRLALLIEAGYIDRRYVLYGVPRLYFATRQGKALIHVSLKPDQFRIEQITHDIAVLDTAIYFMLQKGMALGEVQTEKELHQQDGFGGRKHKPDFVYQQEGRRVAVEVELTPKSGRRLIANLRENFLAYDGQWWVIPGAQPKITQLVAQQAAIYPNLEILPLEEITQFMKSKQQRS